MAPKKKAVAAENQLFYIQYGIDLIKRKIMIDEEIEESAIGWVIRAITLMVENNPEDPIEIYINSFGGCVYSGLALYDLLDSLSTPIHTYCLGSAMSMSLVLYLVGDIRYSFPRSTFMAHSVSSGTEGTVRVQEVDIKEAKRLNDILIDILADRTKKSKKFWAETVKHDDFYMDSKKAKQLGIVTEIIE